MTRAVALVLALCAVGCACIPPDGPNHRVRLEARWDALVTTYEAHGHVYHGAPFGDLHVTVRHGLFECGGADVPTEGCASWTWPACPSIVVSVEAWDTPAVEHELLHFLLSAHGIESSNHAGDFRDFFRIMYRAHTLWRSRQ